MTTLLPITGAMPALGEGSTDLSAATTYTDVNALAEQFRKDTSILSALPAEAEDGRNLRSAFDAYFDAALNGSSSGNPATARDSKPPATAFWLDSDERTP